MNIRKYCNKTAVPYESGHFYADKLTPTLLKFYREKGAHKIADMGCGRCDYVDDLRKNGFEAYGFEYTIFNHNDYIKKMDLSQPANLGQMFDFVQSFEVGEHIYEVYENNFIENILNHARLGVVLSWAIYGQQGFMHVNNRDNEHIIRKVESYGFKYSPEDSYIFRREFNHHFASTIMVFFKN